MEYTIESWQVGQKVGCSMRGNGVIELIVKEDYLPLKVRFKDYTAYYEYNGKPSHCSYSTLRPFEIEIIKKPEFKAGDNILVNICGTWTEREFCYETDKFIYCIVRKTEDGHIVIPFLKTEAKPLPKHSEEDIQKAKKLLEEEGFLVSKSGGWNNVLVDGKILK